MSFAFFSLSNTSNPKKTYFIFHVNSYRYQKLLFNCNKYCTFIMTFFFRITILKSIIEFRHKRTIKPQRDYLLLLVYQNYRYYIEGRFLNFFVFHIL